MPKIKDIVKIEKGKLIIINDELSAIAKNKAEQYNKKIEIYNSEQSDLGNKSIGLDEGKMAEKLFFYYHPEIDTKKLVQLNEADSKYNAYFLNVWKQCLKQAKALKQAEGEIICEVKG